MSTATEHKKPGSTLWLLWGVLLASQLLYLGLVIKAAPPTSPRDASMVVPLAAVAALQGLAALAIHFLLLGDERLRAWLQELRRDGRAVGRDDAQRLAMARLQPMSVLSWALAESVTLMGVALAFMGQLPLIRFVPFLLAGMAIQALCLPRAGRLEELVGDVFSP